MLQSNSSKSYFDPAGFTLVFGGPKGNQWTVERHDEDTFSISSKITSDDAEVAPTGAKYSFDYKEFLNLGQALGLASLPMLYQDDSLIVVKEKSGNPIELRFLPGPAAVSADPAAVLPPPKYRPLLRDPKAPANDLPLPESIAMAIITICDSLNKRL
jgi:hypothetical protein